MKTHRFLIPLVMVAVLATTAQSADYPSEQTEASFQLNGFARASAWGAGEAHTRSSIFAEIALQGEYRQGNAFLETDLRLRKGSFFGEDVQTLQLKSLVCGYSGQFVDLLAGYQNISWGRTDGFNPTNYLQSADYFFLTADPADQSLPNLALRTRLRLNSFADVDFVLMPFYLPSVYRFELFEMGNNVNFAEAAHPDAGWKNGSMAGRLNFELPGLGFSLSGFRGYDPYHGFRVKSVDWSGGQPLVTNAASSYQKTALGADLSVPAGAIILKAEAAWNHTSRAQDEMYIPMSYWMYVGGIEAKAGASTLVISYIGHYTPDFRSLAMPLLTDPMNPQAQMAYAGALIDYENRQFNRRIFHQQEKANHALSVSWIRRFAYDAVEARLSIFYDLTSGEWLTRPMLKWSLSDNLSVSLGGQYLSGDDKTLFSYAASVMNGVVAEIRIHF